MWILSVGTCVTAPVVYADADSIPFVSSLFSLTANDQIHFVGTFPLVSCGPGIVATICAIVFFREIQGRKNYFILAAATAVTIVGVVLIAFSLPEGS